MVAREPEDLGDDAGRAGPASGFSLKLALKDVTLILQQSQSAQAGMPAAETLQEVMQKGVAMGFGDQDVIAIARVPHL